MEVNKETGEVKYIQPVSIESVLSRRKRGAVIRAYAHDPAQVQKRVDDVARLVEKIKSIKTFGRNFINEIDIPVWMDRRYKDSDCGLTANALRERFSGQKDVRVHDINIGGIFCDCLNEAMIKQHNRGCHYSLIVSAEAESYLTPSIAEKIVQGMANGALAGGVAIKEAQIFAKKGRIANTLAFWSLKEWLLYGGMFDQRSEKPIDENRADWRIGRSPKGRVYYPKQGVEETITLCREAMKIDEPFICVIDAEEGEYLMPDPNIYPAEFERIWSKFGTKDSRMWAMADYVNFHLDDLVHYLM